MDYSETSLGGLSQLSSLTSLDMPRCQHPPANLAAFTALRQLILDVAGMGEGERFQALSDALPALQQLTCLELDGRYTRLPATLSSTNLRMFYLQSEAEWEVLVDEAQEQIQLPPGPWLQSLTWLAVPWAVLANSPAALAAARQLEHVCITGVPRFGSTPDAKRDAFRAWPATHPSLQYLSFDFVLSSAAAEVQSVPLEVFSEALLLTRRRPSLKVFQHVPGEHPCFYCIVLY